MEAIILICLLISIVLLMQDRIVIGNGTAQNKSEKKKVNPELPDIMGQTKSFRSLSVLNTANESQELEPEINPDNLDIEYDKNDTLSIQIPQEELDEVFRYMLDFEEEEEEWDRQGISDVDFGFAQGVTFDELSTMEVLLQEQNLQTPQKEKAIAIVQKLQGTELFNLLENSIEGASRKIAQLLDSTLIAENETGSSILRKNDVNEFNIEDFV